MSLLASRDGLRRRKRGKKMPNRVMWNTKPKPILDKDVQAQVADTARHYFQLAADGQTPPLDFDQWVAGLAYIRVSTDDQAKHFSPDAQRNRIAAYCGLNRIRVVDEFFDTDSGDVPLSSRPEGMALLKALKDRRANSVVVLCLDRLARNEVDAHITWRLFRREKIDLHFVQRGKQEDDAYGRLMYAIEAGMASFERSKITERMKDGRRQKLAKGQWMGNQRPYGYRREGSNETARLVIYEAEARVVRLIFQLYVWGEKGGTPLSLRGLAANLSDRQIPRPSTSKGGDPTATNWSETSVRNILINTIYKGVYTHYNQVFLPKEYDTQPMWERAAITSDNERVRVSLPDLALVSDVAWAAAARRLQANMEMKNRQRAGATLYLLSGHLICAQCGKYMAGKRQPWSRLPGEPRNTGKRSKRNAYRCNDRLGVCPVRYKYVGGDVLDERIWSVLRAELDEPRLSDNLDRLRARSEDTAALTTDRMREIEASIREDNKTLKRLAEALGRTDNATVIATIEERMAKTSQSLARSQTELKMAHATLEQATLTPERERLIREMAAAIRRRMNGEPTVEQKRAILSSLEVKVTIDMTLSNPSIELEWCLGAGASFYLYDEDAENLEKNRSPMISNSR